MKKRKNKALRHPLLRTFAIIAVAVSVCVAFALFILLSGSNMASSATEMPFLASSQYCSTQTGVLYVSGLELKYHDFSDSGKSYSIQLASADIKLAGYGLNHVTYGYNSLQIIGLQFPIEFAGEIIGVRCHDNYVAVHRRENGIDSIRTFDLRGTQLDELSFDGLFLSDFGFYNAGKTVYMYSLTVNYKASSPVTTLTMYNVSPPATTGILSIQNQLVSAVGFTDKSVFAVGTQDIIRYRADGNYESYRLLSYGSYLHDFSLSGSNCLFLMRPNDSVEYNSVKIYRAAEADIANELVTTLQLPKDTRGVFASGNTVFVLTPTQILKYNSSGALTDTQTLPFAVTSAEKISDSRILVASGEKIYMLTFK